jgi:hypothetical protein
MLNVVMPPASFTPVATDMVLVLMLVLVADCYATLRCAVLPSLELPCPVLLLPLPP